MEYIECLTNALLCLPISSSSVIFSFYLIVWVYVSHFCLYGLIKEKGLMGKGININQQKIREKTQYTLHMLFCIRIVIERIMKMIQIHKHVTIVSNSIWIMHLFWMKKLWLEHQSVIYRMEQVFLGWGFKIAKTLKNYMFFLFVRLLLPNLLGICYMQTLIITQRYIKFKQIIIICFWRSNSTIKLMGICVIFCAKDAVLILFENRFTLASKWSVGNER